MTQSRIYTRTGDDGETGLFGGRRIPKDDHRLEAYGTIDELNSLIGLAAATVDEDLRARLQIVQSDLFDIGGELATPDLDDRIRRGQVVGPRVTGDDVGQLERWIDALDEEIEPLTRFILPGGTVAAGHLHVARTVCRRAERRLLTMSRAAPVSPEIVRYLNRLSDLLFTVARVVNRRAEVDEPQWLGREERTRPPR